jgi:hypothetical protein
MLAKVAGTGGGDGCSRIYGLMVCPDGCACGAGGCTAAEPESATTSFRVLPRVRILGDLRADATGVGDCECTSARAAARPLVTRFSVSFEGG